MVLPAAPEPRYWKALLFAAIPTGVIVWLVLRLTSMPGWLEVVIWLGASAAIGGIVHQRVSNDWRAQYTMNLQGFEKRANVARSIRVKRR